MNYSRLPITDCQIIVLFIQLSGKAAYAADIHYIIFKENRQHTRETVPRVDSYAVQYIIPSQCSCPACPALSCILIRTCSPVPVLFPPQTMISIRKHISNFRIKFLVAHFVLFKIFLRADRITRPERAEEGAWATLPLEAGDTIDSRRDGLFRTEFHRLEARRPFQHLHPANIAPD